MHFTPCAQRALDEAQRRGPRRRPPTRRPLALGALLPAGTHDIFLDAWDDDGGQGVYMTSVQLP